MARTKLDIERKWTRLGATARLAQIEHERNSILASFPELRRKSESRPFPEGDYQRRTISPKGRKAMSAGMRRYWAKRKAAQLKPKSA